MNDKLIEKAKALFLQKREENGDRWNLRMHLRDAERWAKYILKKYPEADKTIIMLTVWLHDIGYFPAPKEDHAIVSERVAKKFLADEKVEDSLAQKVLHCVRSHRNKDVIPNSFEAKLFVMIDSISHFTWLPYIVMAQDNRASEGLEKLERDYRDIQLFPDIVEEIAPLYISIKEMLTELDKINDKL